MASRQKVNINTASEQELAALPMIGDERAQTLVDQRPFSRWEEVGELPGFTKGLIRDLQDEGAYLGDEDEW